MQESTSPSPLQKTPLFEACVARKARMTEFSGWEMPVQFSGILQEHQAVRTQVGMFDISHMGKFVLQGHNLIEQLQTLVPSDLARLQPGQAQYSVLLNDQAGILDDIIFYYQGETQGQQHGVLIVNAATRIRDKAWLMAHLDPKTIDFQDLSKDQVLIALQGPQAATILQAFTDVDLSPIPRFGHIQAQILGTAAFIARTGYTGEDGFEIMLDPAVGVELWQKLEEAGVTPCGLGARDTLRLEAAMALYGQDIIETTTPYEAGLGWLVHLDKAANFKGRAILEEQKAQGVQIRLVGLQTQGRYIARHGYPVLFEGKPVGEVTSGTLSPTLGYPIALAYVPASLAKINQALDVEIRGKAYPAVVVKKPFYKPKGV